MVRCEKCIKFTPRADFHLFKRRGKKTQVVSRVPKVAFFRSCSKKVVGIQFDFLIFLFFQ